MRPYICCGLDWASSSKGGGGGVIRFVVQFSGRKTILVHVAATIHVEVGNQWNYYRPLRFLRKLIGQLMETLTTRELREQQTGTSAIFPGYQSA